MPRLLDNRIVGGAIDVFNRTPESLVPGRVLTVLNDGRTVAFVPAVTGPTGPQGLQGFSGFSGAQGPQGISGISGRPGPPSSVSNYSYQIHFTSTNGSFRVPPGLTVMVISAIGGGGGGSIGASGDPPTGGQSGCPSNGFRARIAVIPGQLIQWTVGAGGLGGGTGQNGGNTVVNVGGIGDYVSPGGIGAGSSSDPATICGAWAPPVTGAMIPVELVALGYGSGGGAGAPDNPGNGGGGAVYLEWIQINDTNQAVIT